jgi:sterol 3beta-glucosyltransferase
MALRKITVLAFGSVGDVLPYFALAAGLESAGYQVTFVAAKKFEETARNRVADFRAIDEDPEALLSSNVGQDWLSSSSNPLKLAISSLKIMQRNLPRYAAHALRESKGAELIISSNLASLVAPHVAESLGARHIPAFPMPVTPTRTIPNAFVPLNFANGASNWLSHRAFHLCCSTLMRRLVNRMRRDVFSLPPRNSVEPFRSIQKEEGPMLYCYSPAVLPRPGQWKSWTHVTGYWFPPSISEWQPPGPLIDFLEAGPPPVCVGFGSMVDREPERTAETVTEALNRVGCRGIILSGWSGLKAKASSDSIFVADAVDHRWLFPRTAAVVHHGGAGVTAAALNAGVPSVAVPFFADQFFWARTTNRLGVAPMWVPRSELTAEALGSAIATAVSEPAIRERALSLAGKIQLEDGVGSAVAFIGRYLS